MPRKKSEKETEAARLFDEEPLELAKSEEKVAVVVARLRELRVKHEEAERTKAEKAAAKAAKDALDKEALEGEEDDEEE